MQGDSHQRFMSTYGCLLEGIRIRHLGLLPAVLTPIIELIQALIVALAVTRLLNWPIFTIFVFNFSFLFTI